MSDSTTDDGDEYRDGAQRDEQAERIGDAIRDGEIETAVEELANNQYVVYVKQDDDG